MKLAMKPAMKMPAGLRKAALVVHIACSVGWLGAIVAFLAVASAAPPAWAHDATQLIVRTAVVPAAFASLASGLFSSLGTTWGLLRHYWVIFKLVLNLFATAVLLLYAQSMDERHGATDVVHASGALLVLVAATALAVYKPRGTTAYGRRRPPITGGRRSRARIHQAIVLRYRSRAWYDCSAPSAIPDWSMPSRSRRVSNRVGR